MSRWVLLVVVTPIALCVVCASLGYFVVWPKVTTGVRSALTEEMANSVAASVSAKIGRSDQSSNQVVLTAADVDVNNVESVGDDCGFDTGTDGTAIYGVVTEIGPDGIALTCGVTYWAVPAVANGRFEITSVELSHEAMSLLLPKESVGEALEQGFNRALASHGLTPTAITLSPGSMTLDVSRTS